MTHSFSFLEFFAGGGMARLGLGDSWQCALANDIDPQKCAAYRANFGEGHLFEGDIGALSLENLPETRMDLMWGSFPCQDLSLAGSRGGLHARRSGAFFPFWRLVEELCTARRGPKIIALENVTGLLTSNDGRDFAAVINALAAQGYCATAMVLDAAAFTPQSRPRLFILGFAKDAMPSSIQSEPSEATAPPAMMNALNNLNMSARDHWIWLSTSPARKRNIRLSEIIDWSASKWHTPSKTKMLLSMMSETQRARINGIIKNGARRAGTGFRRTRTENAKSVQRFEARFDNLAGCLRTPAGGSSRQVVIAIENGQVRTRLMTPREAARLMGLPEDYKLPTSDTAALKLCGDGVCAPVVQWLSETVFIPALQKQNRKAA
ncbi:MAG: DNA (cytosine-5-)-methyltransferase [Hyphococcus sp.]|nr:MAG: DNA (cytosine-5-)-methyltransferase [Marinicaulis sp.]